MVPPTSPTLRCLLWADCAHSWGVGNNLCGLNGTGACQVSLFWFAGVPACLAVSQNMACSFSVPRCPCRQDGGEQAGCQVRQVASQPGRQSSLINEVVETWREVSTGTPRGSALARSRRGVRLTWAEQLLLICSRLYMKLSGRGSLSPPMMWVLVPSHSADGDTEACGVHAVYPKSLSWEMAKLDLEHRSIQLQSLCL